MHITVDPGKFCDQKLELRSIGENDYRIVISNHTLVGSSEPLGGAWH